MYASVFSFPVKLYVLIAFIVLTCRVQLIRQCALGRPCQYKFTKLSKVLSEQRQLLLDLASTNWIACSVLVCSHQWRVYAQAK